MKKIGLLTLLLFLVGGTLHAEDDFQYWSRFAFTPIKTENFSFTNFSELRIKDDASNLGLWYTSQRFKLTALKYADLGLNHTYLENEVDLPRGRGNEWKYQHRLELEINPKWTFENGVQILNRNRLEFRWIEGKGSDNQRLRQLWQVQLPLKKWEFLKSIYANNEFFIDFNRHTINENRVTPLGINFKLPANMGFQIFYQIQSQKGKDWRSNQVLGTKCSLTL